MSAIDLRAEGLQRLEALFQQLLRRSRDLSPLMDRIGQAIETTTRERFERGEAPDGGSWTKSRRARETGGKTLIDSGRLSQSITHAARATEVEVGTNVIYGPVHQYGATIRAKNGTHLKFKLPGGLGFRTVEQVVIPARPFLGLDDEDREEIPLLVEDYLLEGMGA